MADKMLVRGVAGRGCFTSSKNTAEERLLKEKLLDEKMKLIRQKNEERLRRQKEIEDDIKNASLHSQQVAEEKLALVKHNVIGVHKENSSVSKVRGRARGRILEKMAKEELQAHRFINKRKKNYEIVEKELQEEKSKDSLMQRSSSSFLTDNHRVDMSRMTSRSIHSWGGSQFEDVVENVNKEHSRPQKENQNIELSMTGKDRKEYLEWKDERTKIDRQGKMLRKSGDTWQREWDKCKVYQANSIQEIPDQQDKAEQRFWDRSRRRKKPSWDLSNDRVAETEQDSRYTYDLENSIDSNYQSEDWEDSSSTSQKVVLDYYSIATVDLSTTTLKDVPKNEETNVKIVKTGNVNSENQNVDITKKANTKTIEDCQRITEPRIEEMGDEHSQIMNLTITVNSKGKGNFKDKQKANNLNSYPDGSKATICKDLDICNEITQKDVIEQQKPQRVHKEHTYTEKKETQSIYHKEKEVKAKQTISSLQKNKVDMTDKQIKSDNTNDVTFHHQKAKDNLPNLEIKKADGAIEPDFLKTPQKKNWADCEFDEEFVLPPLEWDSLTKQYLQ